MTPLRQSLCLPPFHAQGASNADLIDTAERVGYAAIEVWGRDADFREIVDAAHAKDLVVASMVGHWTHEEGLNDPANHARIEDELRESIDIAATHSIPGIICLSGNRRPGVSEAEAAEVTVAGLQPVLPYAAEKGVLLNLELLNSKVDHPDYQADNTAWGVQVCELANHPNLRLLYDIYHMQIMEGDVIRSIREHIQWIGHFHTAGVPGRHDIDASQELNYAAIAQAIAETDFAGYVAHEFWTNGDPLQAAESAFHTCEI
ncbi:MAG: hydroxypyruvate isomerase [Rhodothermales bacterium]|jgi:hydroxypyruvate isomerase